MILTKETQEKLVNDYLKNNSTEKTEGFIDGINEAFKLIYKVIKQLIKNGKFNQKN